MPVMEDWKRVDRAFHPSCPGIVRVPVDPCPRMRPLRPTRSRWCRVSISPSRAGRIMEVKAFWWFIGLIWKWILKHGTEIKASQLPPEHQALIMDAIKVREGIYSYSKFKVGVALGGGSNIPFIGCNIGVPTTTRHTRNARQSQQ